MAASKNRPRLSVNKLGEYLTVGPARRRRIIHDAKFPSDAIRPYYTPAEQAISEFIADGMHDIGKLENRIKLLGQSHPESVWDTRRIASNIDAIEAFMNMLDDIDLSGAEPALGNHKAPHVTLAGVDISVRPEIILTNTGTKGQPIVGGLKLHFPRSNPLNAQAAGYISTMVHEYANDHLPHLGTPDAKCCLVIDVASEEIYPGPGATKKRLKDLEAACAEIVALWPNITE